MQESRVLSRRDSYPHVKAYSCSKKREGYRERQHSKYVVLVPGVILVVPTDNLPPSHAMHLVDVGICVGIY
jgi:hypothetical protein